jgi:imidazolonepropionase
VLERGDVLLSADRIVSVGTDLSLPPDSDVIEADGRVLMPGLIDCHTHACWAGDRVDEWSMRLGGAEYLDILKAGGGIMSTVRAVRATTEEGLIAQLRRRLAVMLAHGTTTVEVKSGYGLIQECELKMLRAIRRAVAPGTIPERRVMEIPTDGTPMPRVVATALLGHAIDPEVPGFVERTISETLPAVHTTYPDISVDAFCEKGAWSLDDSLRLLRRAKELGHPVRIHADQFTSLGMVPEAVRLGALSIDHLEATSKADMDLLAKSDTFAVVLPCCGVHVDGRFANVRRFVSAGGLLSLATNYNPGSAPCPSMPMAIGLAVRYCGLSPSEAIAAATVNPATLLGFTDRGAIAPGLRADLLLLRHTDERMLAYEFGCDHVETVILGGRIVKGQAPSGRPVRS